MSIQWNQQLIKVCVFESNRMLGKTKHSNEYKTIEKYWLQKKQWIQNKQLEYKTFQLKYENTKLLNFEKYESVSSVLAVFTSTYYLCDLQEKRH